MKHFDYFLLTILIVLGLLIVRSLFIMDDACEKKGGKLVRGIFTPVCIEEMKVIE